MIEPFSMNQEAMVPFLVRALPGLLQVPSPEGCVTDAADDYFSLFISLSKSNKNLFLLKIIFIYFFTERKGEE